MIEDRKLESNGNMTRGKKESEEDQRKLIWMA